MATLQELMAGLKNQRDRASENSPVATTLGKAVSGMNLVASAVSKLHGAIEDQVAANLAARKTGEAKDVQQTIRNLLQAKVAENTIERERNKRMMDMAERVVPQVTEEQLETLRLQQEAYRTHKKAMADTIGTIEKERAAAEFAVKDKYGTIESAIGGLGAKAQDPLSKFLVSGLGRFVKERKESPVSAEVKGRFDDLVEDAKEKFAVTAAREGISDPGSAAKLYMDRAQQVKSMAGTGASLEKSLMSGKAAVSVPQMESAVKDVASAIRSSQAVVPTLTKAGISEKVGGASVTSKTGMQDMPAVTAGSEVSVTQAPPANARFEKAPVQGTRLMTPAVSRAPQATVTSPAVGALGSKVGAVNLAGIGSALGGMVTQLGSLAGSAVKFLGPWSLAANALMSFDRMVPLVSTGAGALMDMSKLLMPITITALSEGFAGLLSAINSLINVIPGTTNLDKATAEQRATRKKYYSERYEREFEEQQRIKDAITGKSRKKGNSVTILNTTSARRNIIRDDGPSITRMSAPPLTTPTEASVIEGMSQVSQRMSAVGTQSSVDWEAQAAQNQALRDAVMESVKNPGTTPIMLSNPYMVPWFV